MKKSVLRIGIDARVLGERGVGRYLANLLHALCELKGNERYTLFTSAKSRSELAPLHPRVQYRALKGVSPALAEQWLIPRLARQLGLDAIHYPDNSGAMMPGLPMVLTMHDGMWQRPMAEALHTPSARQRLQDIYRKFVCPRAAAAAAAVITVSRFSARELEATLHLGSKLHVVPNALGREFSAPPSRSRALGLLHRDLGLRGPYVFISGAADRRKNVSRMIRAFGRANVRGLELIVTSLRPGEKESTDYEAVVASAGLQGRVRFLGFVSEEQLQALYLGAEAYLFPSLWEGFGLPLLEAFALDCPVLASDRGALPEVAGKGALLVNPESEAELAAGLLRILSEGRRVWAPRGRKELRRFSWRRSAEATLRIYRSLAA